MKIKVEFDINVDIQKVISEYGNEGAEQLLNVSSQEHLQKITKFLKEEFEDDCTDVKVNSLSVSKGVFKNKVYRFDDTSISETL